MSLNAKQDEPKMLVDTNAPTTPEKQAKHIQSCEASRRRAEQQDEICEFQK